MIYLGAGRSNLLTTAGIWEKRLRTFLFKRRKSRLRIQSGRKILSTHATYFDKMNGEVLLRYKKKKLKAKERDHVIATLKYFKRNFADIVTADEATMKSYNARYERRMKGQRTYVKNLTKNLFIQLYDDFSRYVDNGNQGKSNAHYFFNLLNIRTCPYCNRLYTFTLDEKTARTGPEYDHFYDKSDYPLLAVSFYNLVPSCHVCNHVKGTKKAVRLNPFFAGFDGKFALTDGNNHVLTKAEVLKQGGGVISILPPNDIQKSADEKGNIETFGLDGLYKMHEDYVADIVTRVAAYDHIARQSLISAFQHHGQTPQDVYDFVWGQSLELTQYENRPLSKLTKEILEQLGIKRS